MNEVIFLAFAAGLIWVGSRTLRFVRRAKETGIADFPFQWPNGFSREGEPWKYHYTVTFQTVFGLACYAGAGWTVLAVVHKMFST